MYSLIFEVNGKELKKKAKTAKEVRRLVYLYTNGNFEEKNKMIAEVLEQSNINEIKNK